MNDARNAIVYKLACDMLQLPREQHEFFELDGKRIIETMSRVYDAGYQAGDAGRQRADKRTRHPIIMAIKRVAFILGWVTFWPTVAVAGFSQLVQACGATAPLSGEFYGCFGVMFVILSVVVMCIWCGNWIKEGAC